MRINANILLVENELVNQMVATEMLKNMGCTVDIVENGEEAVQKVLEMADQPYDVILMDCRMPVMDGFEATTMIRQLESEQKIRNVNTIVAMTACNMPEEEEKCLNAGMTDYLSKPVKIDILYEKIQRYF